MALKDFLPEDKKNKNIYNVEEQTATSAPQSETYVPKPSYLDKPANVRQNYNPDAPTAKNPYGTVDANNIYAGAYEKVNSMNKTAVDSFAKARNASSDAAATRLSGQKRNIYQDYENNVNAAGKARDAALSKLPENMSGLGLYGQGVGETAIANIRNAYSNQLTELMKQRDNNIYDIDNQIEALKGQAEADIYNYEAQLMAQNPQYYLQLLEAENNENWRAKEWNHNLEREEIEDNRYATEWAYQVENDDKQYADANTNAMAQFIESYGFVPEGMFPDSKLTENDINKLLALYQRNLYSSGSSGSSGGGGETPKQSGADVISYYNDPNDGNIYKFESYAYDKDKKVNPLYLAKDNLNNTTYLNSIYYNLEAAGYTPSQIKSTIYDMRKDVSKKIAKAEGNGKTYEDIMDRYGWSED